MPLRALALLPLLLFTTHCPGPSTPPAEQTTTSTAADAPTIPTAAVALHNTGLAALENEQPDEAETAYRRLTELVPDDPMPWANLGVALLRQQRTDEALAALDRALALAPPAAPGASPGAGALRGDILAIRGAALDWAGQPEEAFEAYRAAAEASPDDPEIFYSLLRQSQQLAPADDAGEAASAAAGGAALERLVELRPENFVVLLEWGKRALQRGDRAAATAAYLRIRELLWQAPPIAETTLGGVLEALEAGPDDLAQRARVPAARLENVLKITPMYREGLREISTGILAVPLADFAIARPTATWGEPIAVSFVGEALSTVPTAGHGLALGDFDGDGRDDVARLLAAEPAALELRYAAGDRVERLPAPEATSLLAADLWNDGATDLFAFGAAGTAVWTGTVAEGGGAALSRSPSDAEALGGLLRAGAGPGGAAAVFDFDLEGDLDLVVAGRTGERAGLELFRNVLPEQGSGALEEVGARVFPALAGKGPADALVAADLDRDGDPDLLLAGPFGLLWLDNLRQGQLTDRTAAGGLAGAPALRAVAAADLTNDGLPEIVAADADGALVLWRQTAPGRFERWTPAGLPAPAGFAAVLLFDADNDGRLDLAAGGRDGVAVAGQLADGGFRPIAVAGGPGTATALAATDSDGDGDLDLLVAGPAGLHRLENRGGNANGWLAIRLRGLVEGNSKNNLNGVGAVVEVKDGAAYQYREHDGRVSHFGLGDRDAAAVLRVVWNNGVPQNRLAVAGDETLVEEQVLKGSCPFLYAWDGERFRFVTDLLWASPAGLPLAPGVWAPAQPDELVAIPGAVHRPGAPGLYDLRVTEELWEAAYFDRVRLWVVDHPADVEVASSLKIVPGESVPARLHGSRGVRSVVDALDGRGRDVTARLLRRDEVYADGYRRSAFQGVAAGEWSLTFALGGGAAGEEPAPRAGEPIRLLLDGWIFPADASLNLALAQGGPGAPRPALPRLEVETPAGWRVLMPNMGHPAGKTKTMVIDTPPLPPGFGRLRIVSGLWLHWDRISWTTEPADAAPRVVARLEPARAELAFRGFSAPLREAPNAPHGFDYERTRAESPWERTAGPYTRFGDVRALLAGAPDSRSVVLAPGDEIALAFDARAVPPPPAGWRRTLFLESSGWDKDFDRNTWAVERGTLPLPFQGMGVYPWADDVEPPDLADFQHEWLTRDLPGPTPQPESGQ